MKQILYTFILSFVVLVTSAQTVSNKRMPFVDGDRTVTFRYVNKQVKHVTIEGSFPKPMSMVGKDGAWVYRTAPLPSEMYTYRFAIGGKKKVTDSLNPNVVCDIDDSLSYFVVGGYPGSYYMDNNVPHGTVQQLWYHSEFDKNMKQRRLSVYLPAEYKQNPQKRYPVLYLLHGTGGDELAWLGMGRLAQIMDNMIAQHKTVPMIVVMPNGIAEQDAAPGHSPYMKTKALHVNVSSWLGRTERAFPVEVMPFIEHQFRTLNDKKHRAIAGLSMGGLHTIAITANNPDLFDYVGLFSPQSVSFLTDGNIKSLDKVTRGLDKFMAKMPSQWQQRYDEKRPLLTDVDMYKDLDKKLQREFQNPPALYYIAIGKSDPLKPFVDKYRSRLSRMGCIYMYNETSGGHTWENWRRYLLNFLPRLFKNK